MEMVFYIDGFIKPYVRMTQSGKWVKPEAKEYLTSQAALRLQFKNQMALHKWDMFPDKTPLGFSMKLESHRGHRCDLDNLVKAVLDSAQGVVYKNDNWIDKIESVERFVSNREFAVITFKENTR